MIRVVFIAPFNMPVTMRFVSAVAELPDVRMALITQEPSEALAPELRARLHAHYRVADALDVQQLAVATQSVGKQLGGIDRILGTLEQLQIQLGQLRDHFGVDGMGEAASRNFRDKARMKDVLRGAGVPCARHRRLTSVAEGWVFAREVGFPMIIKPPDAAAAKGTHRITDAKGLHEVLSAVRPSPERPVVAEEFVTGRERSFETVTIRGRAVWDSSTRYDPAPLHVLENPWIQWTVLLPREQETADTQAVRPYARAALEALGMGTGISHMEWFRRDRSDAGPVAISEVGARPPGAQIMAINSYAHDVDFFRLWARLVVHEVFDPPPARRFAAGAAFFRGQGGDPSGRRRVVAVHGIEQAQQELGALVVDARLPQVGQPKADSYEGEGYAILRHPDTGVVERALQRLVSLVRVELG
ncbi:MAG: ATP-grasp domain-containing protein [Myxococcales bacterium]|nr:ATP-grasp domain-containing protein [Myxococcales bacterium]